MMVKFLLYPFSHFSFAQLDIHHSYYGHKCFSLDFHFSCIYCPLVNGKWKRQKHGNRYLVCIMEITFMFSWNLMDCFTWWINFVYMLLGNVNLIISVSFWTIKTLQLQEETIAYFRYCLGLGDVEAIISYENELNIESLMEMHSVAYCATYLDRMSRSSTPATRFGNSTFSV